MLKPRLCRNVKAEQCRRSDDHVDLSFRTAHELWNLEQILVGTVAITARMGRHFSQATFGALSYGIVSPRELLPSARSGNVWSCFPSALVLFLLASRYGFVGLLRSTLSEVCIVSSEQCSFVDSQGVLWLARLGRSGFAL